jgi:hypothetical protein
MNFEESYRNRMGIMPLLGAYIKAVIDDQGIEKALEYNRTAAYHDAERVLKNIKKPDEPITPQDAANILGMHESSGMKSVIEVVGNEVRNHTTKCVYYDGWLSAGLEPEVIEQLCRDRFMIFGEKTWKLLNPNIAVELRQFKDKSDGLCLEVIKFKE